MIAALDGRAEVVAPDRPGWDGASEPTGLEGNATAAAAALDRLGIERATVVGHSFGAAVAAWLAATRAERVGALVLAAPAANTASLVPLDRLLATPVAGGLLGAGALAGAGLALTSPLLRRRIARLLSLDSGYLRSAGRRFLTPSSWRAFASEQRTLVRELPLLEARLAQIEAPVTIVAGTRDRIVPLASAQKLASQIPGARLIEVQRADHLIPQHRAAELAEIVLAAGSP